MTVTRKLYTCSITLAASLMIAACGSKSDTQKERFLIRGNDALKQSDYREAIRFYNEAIQIDSCYTPAINNLGITYYEQKLYSKAVFQYQQAINCDPQFLDAYVNRSNALYELNELYGALEDINYVQKQIPDSSSVYFSKGLILAKMRKFNEALEVFNKAYTLDSSNVETLINRGSVKYYLHDLAAAEADLTKAIAIAPKEANAYNAMALIEIERGNFNKALTLVNEALQYELSQPYFLNNRGYIYLQLGDMDKAKADIDLSITYDPNNAWAYRNKGLYYLNSGKLNDAERMLKRTIKLDQYVDQSYVYLAQILKAQEKHAEACEALKKAESQNQEVPQDLAAYCN